MANLEPYQPISRLGFVRPTGDPQGRKEDNSVSVIRSKEVAKKHEECIEGNSLNDFYPTHQVDIGIGEANRNKRED
jgi:hypothetical protein